MDPPRWTAYSEAGDQEPRRPPRAVRLPPGNVGRDVGEERVEIRADGGHRHDDHHRDERHHDPVLNCCRAFLVLPELLQLVEHDYPRFSGGDAPTSLIVSK